MRTTVLLLCLVVVALAQQPVCDPTQRNDCGYLGINSTQCYQRGCCWQPSNNGSPWCFYKVEPPAQYTISSVSNTGNGYTIKLVATGSSLISPLLATISFETADRAHIKIVDPANPRWEIPQSVLPYPTNANPSTLNYAFSYTTSPATFAITRKVDGEVIFNLTQIQFKDQLLTATVNLAHTMPVVFGLGEHVDPFLLNTFSHTYTMWNADVPTPVDQNVYGDHPFYMEMRNGLAHGVFLRNSNGMDVLLQNTPGSVNYFLDGGVFDFFIFSGPKPNDVVSQYHQVIGTPHMPPYWSLGWHQCRYGYPSIWWIEQVVANYSAAGIPLDTIWSDIDHMDQYEDFSFDPNNYPVAEVQKFVQKLHANGQQYVVIVDPGIHTRQGYAPYDQGIQDGIFIMKNDGKTPFVGTVWPGTTTFPDWFNPKAQSYWSQQISNFLNTVPIDGLWIDMNEVSNFNNGFSDSKPPKKSDYTAEKILRNREHQRRLAQRNAKAQKLKARLGRTQTPASDYDRLRQPYVAKSIDYNQLGFDPNNPPYHINNFNSHSALNTKTLAMDCRHYPYNDTYLEYNTHNLFGLMEGVATRTALEQHYGKRSFVLSRSTFAGSGHHVAHWTGDNWASWDSMYYSIPDILNHNMYGIPLVGADICGFLEQTTEELCARWSALGAFYPFSRNHHDIHTAPQEPYLWESVKNIAIKTLGARYALLPYYYTLFWRANQFGGTVARPLVFEFPEDQVNTAGIDKQFLIGPALLITPVLTQGAQSVAGYFPPASTWYDFWNFTVMECAGNCNLFAPLEHIPVHVRSGYVIPMQVPALTTAASRLNPFQLLVIPDSNGNSVGEVFIDDGSSLQVGQEATYVQYKLAAGNLVANVMQANQPTAPPALDQVTVLGVAQPHSVSVNNQPWTQFSYAPLTQTLTIQGLSLAMTQGWNILWA